MIADLDEALRKLLLEEIAIEKNDIDIRFNQPTREWSSRISRPTINLFLFDIRENWMLRTAEAYRTIKHQDGFVEIRRNPVRMDLRYLVTAWIKEPEDEHLLLSAALIAFLRHPFIPERFLPDALKEQPAPIPLFVATYTEKKGPEDKLSEIWGVLDNEMRPSLLLTATIAMDPYQPISARQVRTREIRFAEVSDVNKENPSESETSLSKTYWSIAGTITSKKHTPSTLSVFLVEKGITVDVDKDGHYSIHRLEEGTYTLDIKFNNTTLKRQKIKVPDSTYDVDV